MRVERALRLNRFYRQHDPFMKDPVVTEKRNDMLVREERGTQSLIRNWLKFLMAQD